MKQPISFQASLNLAVKVLRARNKMLKAMSQGKLREYVQSKVPANVDELDLQPISEQEGSDMGNQQQRQKQLAAQVFSGLTEDQRKLLLAALTEAGVESAQDLEQLLTDSLEVEQDLDKEEQDPEPLTEEEQAQGQGRSQEGRFESGIQPQQQAPSQEVSPDLEQAPVELPEELEQTKVEGEVEKAQFNQLPQDTEQLPPPEEPLNTP
jgi:hypothetical protein